MNLIVKLGRRGTFWHMIVSDYSGPMAVNHQLLTIVADNLRERYGENAILDFDHIEIHEEWK